MRFPGSRGYVTGDNELRLLYHRRLSAQKEAVHEFAHVVSMYVNSTIPNNPRWLWEAVALYENQGTINNPIFHLVDSNYANLSTTTTDLFSKIIEFGDSRNDNDKPPKTF